MEADVKYEHVGITQASYDPPRLQLPVSDERLIIARSWRARRLSPATSRAHLLCCTLVGLILSLHLCILVNAQWTDPNLDDDGDGIPNGWEQAHGLDPLNPDDASADNDGDGMSNLQEYLAGTDPNNAASRFAITSLALTNGRVRVSWSAVGGKSYVVQTNSALGASFADASPVIIVPGTSETVTNYLDPGFAVNDQARYYRVRLGP
jgi:hypothetical protein